MLSVQSQASAVGPPRSLAWLHILGAALVVAVSGLFSAVHSPLGREISAGESPGFDWFGANIIVLTGFTLVYLIVVCWLQIRQMRPLLSSSKFIPLLVCIELIEIALVALVVYLGLLDFLPPVLTVLLVVLLLQALFILWRPDPSEDPEQSVASDQYSTRTGPFLVLFFIMGALIAILDPSWHRLADQVFLDSAWEYNLRYIYPPLLSGVTTVWFGSGIILILVSFRWLQPRIRNKPGRQRVFNFLIFFSLAAAFAAFLLLTLYHAIPWQIHSLNLSGFVWQLFLFLSTAGGMILTAVFHLIAPHLNESGQRSMIGVVALTLGAALLFPLAWLLVFRLKKAGRSLFLIITLGWMSIGWLVLFGDFFDPWFTAFSYLKGAILKLIAVAAAGSAGILVETSFFSTSAAPSNLRRPIIALGIVGVLGFLPFYSLGKSPEVKAAVLQYHELTRVYATFAREFTRALGIGKWFHLGQRPPLNASPDPWPQPWRLEKTHRSLLPPNFNLLVIVADALRGDAFHSAGYHRDLTPFLDGWAREEGLSFRRAYSQGGGSFAAYPFLVAGRSRLDLYGPELYRQNLYFKIAQAEGIQHYMLMKGFGPRAIYPPDIAVTELAIPRPVSDRRSASADEVFDAARRAISSLPEGQRFLSFLTLMDVHNDLWPKEDGIDFGDTPRDLYDNNLSYLDRAFKRFISWLKKEGMYNRTVILFTADHGEQFWEHGASLHGHTVYEEEIRIPLILVSHAIQKRVEDVPVIAADMAPTIADLAGYSVVPPYDDPYMGISLMPLIHGKEKHRYLKRNVVGRASFQRRYFLYRNWEWKLVFFAELDLLQLFNVMKDPSEKHNLLGEEPGMAAELEHELFGYLHMVEGKTYRPILSQQ